MRALAAAVLAVPLLLAPIGTPAAQAASCVDGRGVEVVVEYDRIGLPDAVDCAPHGGGEVAARLFEATGHPQEQVQRFPGAVCRVDGQPVDAECVDMPPADSYWALFWSDGRNGWVYSQLGAYSLKVPEGGKVAWVWQHDTSRNTPDVSPTRARATQPAPPAPAGTGTPGGSGTPGGAGSPAATPSSGPPASGPSSTAPPAGEPAAGSTDAPTDRPTPAGSGPASGEPATPGAGQERGRSTSTSASPTRAASGGEQVLASRAPATGPEGSAAGLPVGWVLGVLALLAVAAGAAVVRRRRP